MTVQFYAVAGTISEDCAKFVTVVLDPVIANTALRSLETHCGSGLARECGGSAKDALTDTPHSRASPLPHLVHTGRDIGSDAEGLHGGSQLPAQYQQVFALATALANAQ